MQKSEPCLMSQSPGNILLEALTRSYRIISEKKYFPIAEYVTVIVKIIVLQDYFWTRITRSLRIRHSKAGKTPEAH